MNSTRALLYLSLLCPAAALAGSDDSAVQVDLKADFVMTTKVEGMSMPIRSSMEVGILMETLPDAP